MDNNKIAKLFRMFAEVLEDEKKPARQGAVAELSGNDFRRMIKGQTVGQAAKSLGVSEATIKSWLGKKSKPLPAARVEAIKALEHRQDI